MMEQALEKGQQLSGIVLELAQLAPGELRAMLQPLWAANGKTIRQAWYSLLSSLDRCTAGFLPGRAEQHLAGQDFSGLTRFKPR